MLLATSGGGGGGGVFAAGGPAPTADGATFDDDEAFARALQAEEDQARWMALAGVAPGGGDVDNTEEGATENMTYEQLSTLTDAVGAVPRAASDAARARVTATRYRSGGDGGGGGGGQEEEQCAVCRVELADGNDVSALPCGHAYHPDCIAAWLAHGNSCPVCGRELEEEEKG